MTNNILRPVITSLLVLIAVTILIFRTDVATSNWANDEFDYALRTATQDATMVMMDSGYIFGMDEEPLDFYVDIDKATEQFKSSFKKNIGSTINANMVNDMTVSFSGYVGYNYIYGRYGDGNSTLPFSYGYTHTDGKLYEFTLGEKVYVTDLSTNNEVETKLSDYAENFFDDSISNEQFRQITVMSTINEFLTVFYSDEANTVAMNAGSGVEFNLGLVDYAADDPSVMTDMSAVIDGPGFFAVVDYFDTNLKQLSRIVSFSAAELTLKDS